MVDTVIWAPEAQARFDQVIRYLKVNWSDRVAADLVSKVDSTIALVRMFPKGARRGRSGTREMLVTEHNLMIFRVKRNVLEIVGFWDTRWRSSKRRISRIR